MNDQRFKRKGERNNSVTDSKNSTRRLTTGNYLSSQGVFTDKRADQLRP